MIEHGTVHTYIPGSPSLRIRNNGATSGAGILSTGAIILNTGAIILSTGAMILTTSLCVDGVQGGALPGQAGLRCLGQGAQGGLQVCSVKNVSDRYFLNIFPSAGKFSN
jgi:hypothetical protein